MSKMIPRVHLPYWMYISNYDYEYFYSIYEKYYIKLDNYLDHQKSINHLQNDNLNVVSLLDKLEYNYDKFIDSLLTFKIFLVIITYLLIIFYFSLLAEYLYYKFSIYKLIIGYKLITLYDSAFYYFRHKTFLILNYLSGRLYPFYRKVKIYVFPQRKVFNTYEELTIFQLKFKKLYSFFLSFCYYAYSEQMYYNYIQRFLIIFNQILHLYLTKFFYIINILWILCFFYQVILEFCNDLFFLNQINKLYLHYKTTKQLNIKILDYDKTDSIFLYLYIFICLFDFKIYKYRFISFKHLYESLKKLFIFTNIYWITLMVPFIPSFLIFCFFFYKNIYLFKYFKIL